jgi:hypothetical protein
MIPAVAESFRVDAEIERSKRQIQLTLAKVNFFSVFRRKSQSDAATIKVNRESQARIVRAWRIGRVRRKQKGIRIGRRCQVVGLIPGVFGVRKGELG